MSDEFKDQLGDQLRDAHHRLYPPERCVEHVAIAVIIFLILCGITAAGTGLVWCLSKVLP